MTTRSKKKSNVLYAFLALSAFILTGCRTEATIEMHADGKTKEVLIFEDDNGQMASIGRTCENLKNYLPRMGSFAHGEGTRMEDITSPGGPLTCKLTSDKPLNKGDGLVDNGDSYGFAIPKSPMEATETYEEIKLTIQMPSKVTKTNIGKIEGNKVIINNFDYLSTGISITSEKEGGASSFPAPTSVSGKKSDTATSKNDNDGFPVWGWGAIGTAVVAAASAVIAATTRRRKRHRFPKRNV